MKPLWLIVSWLGLCVLTVSAWTLLPPLDRGHPNVHPLDLLPWPPGIAIAIIAGATGGMMKVLFEMWSPSTGQPARGSEEPSSSVLLISPVLGALSGIVIFVLLASGLVKFATASVAFHDASSNIANSSPGSFLYKLTPTSPSGFASLILYTMLAGYFFQFLPELLDALRKRFTNKNTTLPLD